jgi:hypothetical protein
VFQEVEALRFQENMHTNVVNTVTVAHTNAAQRRMIGGISELIGINTDEAVVSEFKLRFRHTWCV